MQKTTHENHETEDVSRFTYFENASRNWLNFFVRKSEFGNFKNSFAMIISLFELGLKEELFYL